MTFINSGANPNGRSNYLAQFKVVAINPITGAYLHMSGAGETHERVYAWSGQRSQFDKLRETLDVEYDLEPAQGKTDG